MLILVNIIVCCTELLTDKMKILIAFALFACAFADAASLQPVRPVRLQEAPPPGSEGIFDSRPYLMEKVKFTPFVEPRDLSRDLEELSYDRTVNFVEKAVNDVDEESPLPLGKAVEVSKVNKDVNIVEKPSQVIGLKAHFIDAEPSYDRTVNFVEVAFNEEIVTDGEVKEAAALVGIPFIKESIPLVGDANLNPFAKESFVAIPLSKESFIDEEIPLVKEGVANKEVPLIKIVEIALEEAEPYDRTVNIVEAAKEENYVEAADEEKFVEAANEKKYVEAANDRTINFVEAANEEKFVEAANERTVNFVEAADEEKFVEAANDKKYVEAANEITINFVEAANEEKFVEAADEKTVNFVEAADEEKFVEAANENNYVETTNERTENFVEAANERTVNFVDAANEENDVDEESPIVRVEAPLEEVDPSYEKTVNFVEEAMNSENLLTGNFPYRILESNEEAVNISPIKIAEAFLEGLPDDAIEVAEIPVRGKVFDNPMWR